jgi:predicted nucleic acid-binding Zn ribbon protein
MGHPGDLESQSRRLRKPRHVSDVLSELFALRGYARVQADQQLADGWAASAGSPVARQTRVGALRRGVLEILVDNSTLLYELATYRKATLLADLQDRLPELNLRDLRFRVGAVS